MIRPRRLLLAIECTLRSRTTAADRRASRRAQKSIAISRAFLDALKSKQEAPRGAVARCDRELQSLRVTLQRFLDDGYNREIAEKALGVA